VLNFNQLLEPISEASPAGEDLTFSVEVDAITHARKFDDPSLDQGEWVVALKEADWGFVYERCMVLLGSKTKDLRLAGWLAEAAAKTRQFEGLAAGFELIAQLCDRYWDSLHPVVEDDDLTQRIGNLAWLLARATQLVKEIPLTEGRESAYSWIDFESARARANHALRTGESVRSTEAQPDISVLELARSKSSKGFYTSLLSSALHCQEMLAKLENSLDQHLGLEGPSFRAIKDTMDNIVPTIERYASIGGGLPSAGVGSVLAGQKPSAELAPKSSSVEPAVAVVYAGITDRAQALEQLRLVAEFFRRTEPHSPVAYLADKAAHWGDLPLHAWLRTVIKDASSLASIEEMLGVKPDNSTD